MATLTLYISDELDQELDRQSVASQLSKNDLACQALRRYLRAGRFRALHSQLVPCAQAQGISTDEDVYLVLKTP